MLATAVELQDIQYPMYVSPKLDGIRAVVHEGQLKSRTLKPIRNQYIQRLLFHLPEGMDGELIVGERTAPDVFNVSSSGVMSVDGDPQFTYWVFDLWNHEGAYNERYTELCKYAEKFPFVRVLAQTMVNTEHGLHLMEDSCLQQGYEGIMLRRPDSPYKFGRSTVKQGYLLKRKPLADAEGVIIGYEFLRVNENLAQTDLLGHTKRSQSQENLVTDYTRLGALEVRVLTGEYEGAHVKIGTGFTMQQRQEFAAAGSALLGELVTFKYQAEGAKDRPRFPSFKGFRDESDI